MAHAADGRAGDSLAQGTARPFVLLAWVSFLFPQRNDAPEPSGLILAPREAGLQRLRREADRREARLATAALLARLRPRG